MRRPYLILLVALFLAGCQKSVPAPANNDAELEAEIQRLAAQNEQLKADKKQLAAGKEEAEKRLKAAETEKQLIELRALTAENKYLMLAIDHINLWVYCGAMEAKFGLRIPVVPGDPKSKGPMRAPWRADVEYLKKQEDPVYSLIDGIRYWLDKLERPEKMPPAGD